MVHQWYLQPSNSPEPIVSSWECCCVFTEGDVCVTVESNLTPTPPPCLCLHFLRIQGMGVSQVDDEVKQVRRSLVILQLCHPNAQLTGYRQELIFLALDGPNVFKLKMFKMYR